VGAHPEWEGTRWEGRTLGNGGSRKGELHPFLKFLDPANAQDTSKMAALTNDTATTDHRHTGWAKKVNHNMLHVATSMSLFHTGPGVPRRKPHRRSGLATLPSVGAIP